MGLLNLIPSKAQPNRHQMMVKLIRDILAGIEPPHLEYMAIHNVGLWEMIPAPLHRAAVAWLMPYTKFINDLSVEDLMAACREARPDAVALWSTKAASDWLGGIFSGLPFFVNLLGGLL